MDFEVQNRLRFTEQVFDARFHPNNESGLIAAVTIAGTVHLIESGVIKSKIRKHHKGSSIRKVRFTADGRMVTIAKTVKVHDLVSGQTTDTLKRDDGKRTTFYSLMPFGHNIISAGDDDGGIFVWDTRTPEEPIFSSYDCEQYISDIDGKFENRKLITCTSGEGTLTAYDLRAKKMIEPQSELFEAGFQCMKMVDSNKKVVIGGEDGSIYVFNHNEWAHTSGKFAISTDLHNRGKCSVDCIDVLPDNMTFLAGCSDGKVRALTLWPHQIMSETAFCKRSPLESIHVHPCEGQAQIVVSGENYINVVGYKEKSDDDEEQDDVNSENDSSNASDQSRSPTNETPSASAVIDSASGSNNDRKTDPPPAKKKPKIDSDDYLNVFK